MKTTIVNENLIMLTRRNLVLPNAYLVGEDDGFTLIDTTTSGGANKLIAAASRAGAKIRRVALTHGHGDHVGSLDELKESASPRAGDGGLPATGWGAGGLAEVVPGSTLSAGSLSARSHGRAGQAPAPHWRQRSRTLHGSQRVGRHAQKKRGPGATTVPALARSLRTK